MSIFPAEFFGLTVAPDNSYTAVLEEDIHLTMATLNHQQSAKGTSRTSVILTINGGSYTLCSLTPGSIENQPLDIYLSQDEEIKFSVSGPCSIDLVGNVVVMVPPGAEDFDEEFDEEFDQEAIDEEVDSDEVDGAELFDESDEEELTEAEIAYLKERIQAAGDAEEEFDSEDDEEMEMDPELLSELKKRVATEPIPKNDKRAKLSEIVEEAEASESEEESDEEEENIPPPKAEKKVEQKPVAEKKVEQKPKAQQKEKVEKKPEAKPEQKESSPESKIRTLPSGLIVEDAVIGKGPRAKSGKKVSVRYIGKLTNGKVFDSNTKGKPFTFRLGKGEVIKGWDVGVQGMNVGGTRKLTIPPALAYGSRGAPPDIPKNATLQFEVKLLDTK